MRACEVNTVFNLCQLVLIRSRNVTKQYGGECSLLYKEVTKLLLTPSKVPPYAIRSIAS